MVRVQNLEKSLDFYCNKLGLKEISRKDFSDDSFTLCFLGADGDEEAQIELTYNWPIVGVTPENYSGGRNFGHLAYSVGNIYEYCASLIESGIIINRPPRDGRMAFIKSPDGISIELLQKGEALPISEPWLSMPNIGEW